MLSQCPNRSVVAYENTTCYMIIYTNATWHVRPSQKVESFYVADLKSLLKSLLPQVQRIYV